MLLECLPQYSIAAPGEINGEYTAANPLAMEYSPKEKRGLNAALIHVGYPGALACASLLTAFLLKVAPSVLGQKFGRRPTIAVLGVLNLFPAAVLYYILVAGAYREPAVLIGLVALILAFTIPVWGVITPYLAESFRAEIRSCGYGISYSAATILPGFYSFYALGSLASG